MPRRFSNKSERGTTMAEFTIIALVFFMLVVGIIEFGRLLYTHNALTDATRRGARYAVLHSDTKGACVAKVVVFGEANINPTTCAENAGAKPLINGLTEAMVTVTYEGADLDNDPATPPTAYGMNLGDATVTIGGGQAPRYQFTLSIPLFRQTFNMPIYTTTLTSESAGTKPADL
ncbi:MAG TPA: TadE family protein [Pyrinomonadaceae bacterium]